MKTLNTVIVFGALLIGSGAWAGGSDANCNDNRSSAEINSEAKLEKRRQVAALVNSSEDKKENKDKDSGQ